MKRLSALLATTALLPSLALAQPASHTYVSTDVVKVQLANGAYANALVSAEVLGVTGGAAALAADQTWTGVNTYSAGIIASAGLTTGAGITVTGTAPVPTGTGTPTIVATSTDTAGEVTGGTSATSIIITFAAAKTLAPFCTVTPQTQVAAFAWTISTTAITITETATTGQKVDYICVQH